MIKFLDLQAINNKYREEFHKALDNVLDSGQFIGGYSVAKFENEFAVFCRAKHCVGVSNGLDALHLILRAYIELGKIQPGSEVLIPANTFIATALAITQAGLHPVLIEVDEYHLMDVTKIYEKITNKTSVIMPVHLYGQLSDMAEINAIAKRHKLIVIEDACQAHGARRDMFTAGSAGDAAAFSFYPGKNLGALGDSGAVTTNDPQLDLMVRKLSNYGSSKKYIHNVKGFNNRMDPLQAEFLSIKLKDFRSEEAARFSCAYIYDRGIVNPLIELPKVPLDSMPAWHLYVIKCETRDHLKNYLEDNGIETIIHYPIPIRSQEAYRMYFAGKNYSLETEITANRILSLPIGSHLSHKELDTIVDVINEYKGI